MKAIIYERSRKGPTLVLREVNKPVPRDHEVLVRIHATSVNALDSRLIQMGIGIPKNKILGADIVGIVEEVGTSVTTFKPGDTVLGDISGSGLGGFAEYVAVSEHALIVKPAGIPDDIAAAIPVAAVTALQALRDKADIKPGMKVLIYGAGGGVGMYAVQLASYFGTQVTAVCSAHNTAVVRSLGAIEVIDYAFEDITAKDLQFDRIIAINGSHSLLAYKRILTPNGIFVLVGGPLRQIFTSLVLGPIMSWGSRKFRTLVAKPNIRDLEFITALVASGKVRPIIDRRYQLEQTAEALRYVGAGHVQGKVVITI